MEVTIGTRWLLTSPLRGFVKLELTEAPLAEVWPPSRDRFFTWNLGEIRSHLASDTHTVNGLCPECVLTIKMPGYVARATTGGRIISGTEYMVLHVTQVAPDADGLYADEIATIPARAKTRGVHPK